MTLSVKIMSARTRIKVCGMIDPFEAHSAVDLGVDALGFIFAPASPRRLEPEKAREIIRSLPPFVDAVGVFVNEDVKAVGDIVRYCGLTVVQLHGDESPDYCRSLDCRVLKAFRIGSIADLAASTLYKGVVSGFLLDTMNAKLVGGTGQVFDWRLLDSCRPSGPLILAGGLTPENVAQAIQQVRPYAVDVNSGVEIAPGRKDLGRLKSFVQEVERWNNRHWSSRENL